MEGRISPLHLKQVFLDIFLIFDKKGFVERGKKQKMDNYVHVS